MSYRNDHDAAIARVDALTHELDRTQAERERLEAEREQLQSEVKHLRKSPLRSKMTGKRFVFTLLAVLAGIALETFGHGHHRRQTTQPPPAPPAAPEPRVPSFTPPPSLPALAERPASTTPASTRPASTRPASTRPATPPPPVRGTADPYEVHLVAVCAANTQSAVDTNAKLTDLRPLRASCRTSIESVVRSRDISAEARQLLTRWIELEDRLAPTLAAYNTYVLRDPSGTHYRAPDALRDEFEAALRARSAVLAAIPDALNQP